MKGYRVMLVYYVKAKDEAEARRKALGLQKSQEPVEIHEVQVELRTERCDICGQCYAKCDMRKREGEYLCCYCDADKYPEDYPWLW